MDDGCGGLHRLLGAEHRPQLLVFDIDEIECGLGDLDRIGRDGRHFLANEARYTLG
jgi:hypothetical protein